MNKNLLRKYVRNALLKQAGAFEPPPKVLEAVSRSLQFCLAHFKLQDFDPSTVVTNYIPKEGSRLYPALKKIEQKGLSYKWLQLIDNAYEIHIPLDLREWKYASLIKEVPLDRIYLTVLFERQGQQEGDWYGLEKKKMTIYVYSLFDSLKEAKKILRAAKSMAKHELMHMSQDLFQYNGFTTGGGMLGPQNRNYERGYKTLSEDKDLQGIEKWKEYALDDSEFKPLLETVSNSLELLFENLTLEERKKILHFIFFGKKPPQPLRNKINALERAGEIQYENELMVPYSFFESIRETENPVVLRLAIKHVHRHLQDKGLL